MCVCWATALTDGLTPGGVGGLELVGEGTVVTEVGAGGADEDAVVNPVADPDADAQQLTSADAEEGAILNVHGQTQSRARHLQHVQTLSYMSPHWRTVLTAFCSVPPVTPGVCAK